MRRGLIARSWVELPDAALDYTRDILVMVSPPAPLIEAITGRRNPLTWFPLIR